MICCIRGWSPGAGGAPRLGSKGWGLTQRDRRSSAREHESPLRELGAPRNGYAIRWSRQRLDVPSLLPACREACRTLRSAVGDARHTDARAERRSSPARSIYGRGPHLKPPSPSRSVVREPRASEDSVGLSDIDTDEVCMSETIGIESCQLRAAECEHIAVQLPDGLLRRIYLDLAAKWRERARQIAAFQGRRSAR